MTHPEPAATGCGYGAAVAVTPADKLVLLGALFEVGGLAMTFADQLGLRRHWFPERHGAWRKRQRERLARSSARVNAWWLRRTDFLRRPHPVYPANIHAAEGIGASVSSGFGSVDVYHPPSTLTDRVERLEAELKAQAERTSATIAAVRDEIADWEATTERRFEKVAAEREREREHERLALDRSFAFQRVGFLLFLLGVGLSAWGGILGNHSA